MLQPDDVEHVLFDEAQIAARVAELGAELSSDYVGRNLLVVGVLTGASIFLCDLVRRIALPLGHRLHDRVELRR